jgi:hypothetical protein
MNSKAYKLPNGKKVIFEYDITGVGKITLECMDELMSMIADISQDDTVSRQYLLAEIDDLADEFSELDENGLHGERWCGIMDAKGVIVNAPDVSDRPQGEWIEAELDKGFRVCSVCKNKGYKDKMAWRTDFIKAYLNYCPNCGAKMKGADDEMR